MKHIYMALPLIAILAGPVHADSAESTALDRLINQAVGASILVDRDMFLQLVREAEQQGATLAVTLVPDIHIQRDRHGNAVPSPCYERMKQAMKAVDPYLQKTGDILNTEAVYFPPSTRLRQAAEAIDREDAAIQQFRHTMKECAP